MSRLAWWIPVVSSASTGIQNSGALVSSAVNAHAVADAEARYQFTLGRSAARRVDLEQVWTPDCTHINAPGLPTHPIRSPRSRSASRLALRRQIVIDTTTMIAATKTTDTVLTASR